MGDEVVFVGGYVGQPCPPNADCSIPSDSVAVDGAAFDVRTERWRTIADAPRPVPASSPTAALEERLYVLVDGVLLVWSSGDDTWETVVPPRPVRWAGLTVDGTRLVLASGTDENGVRPDRVYDTDTGDWSTLPPNPLTPSFDRIVTSTPLGLVLTAQPIGPDGGPADPSLTHAAVLPPGGNQWRKLPPSDQLGGWHWTWTGTDLVDPTPGGADGSEVNGYGRVIPHGGRLDPATGTWTRIKGTPDEFTGGWPVEALGGAVVAVQGWIYDAGASSDGSWTKVPRPEDAPPTPGTATWAGNLLVVLGGADFGAPDGPEEWTPGNVWSTGTWAYRTP